MRRHRHSLSHYRLLTADLGQLIPCGVVEVLPGDTFRQASSALIRAATLTAPLMHPVNARIHHWFVPNRIIWDGWEDFITGKNTTDQVPQLTPDGSDLWDHLGLPNNPNITVNALPIRAYNKIWNEFYRDQDIDTEALEDDIQLKYARWEKDYFTTARPTPQAGDAVTIPIEMSGMAPVEGIGIRNAHASRFITNQASVYETDPDQKRDVDYGSNTDTMDWATMRARDLGGNERQADVWANLNRIQGGQGAAGIDVNELRQAFAFQRFLEHRNRFGSRHVDYLRSLGINPSDGRLDRPEYLGGGKQTLAFSEVLVHSEGATTVPGDMAGHGIAAMRTRRYRRFFEEAGYLISLFSVRPRAMYMDRVNRHWLRDTKDDYWQKEYEQMGPQPIAVVELDGSVNDSTARFGWNGRHDEYRHEPSFVSGAFKTSVHNNWHFARDFQSEPVLNPSFLECRPDPRPFASQITPQLLCMISHRIQARRLVARRARN